eukprot:TRINITY_DN11758_c0_g1_i1.p1 TRINITY_DN11758_c0_g1~~TRINITY_DN11758_c0_g1_i1.p1  ORF type:complete len:344 (-),score=50.08 TRINITY_DN11758_c0_g1_i1:188-1219(-)
MDYNALDKARAHRARQDVHGERDKLLKQGDKAIDHSKFMPDDGKDRARAVVYTLVLATGPGVAYTIVTLAWFYVYHNSFVRFSVILAGLLALSAGMIIASSRSIWGRDRKWMQWLGLFTGQATLVALVLGFFFYFRHLAYFWKYQEMRTYTNVAAAQDDKAFSDGSMFLFTEDTRLDVQRAVGFKSRWTGSVYCVAPLVDSTMSNTDPIHYWAIGVDCCDARADFHCGDAKDTSTRSALVALEPTDVTRSFMTWATRGANYPRFERAVKLQEATYITKAAPEPKLIWWSRDPIALKDNFFSDAVSYVLSVTGVYTLILMVQIYLVSWTLVPKLRLEGVIRYAK